MAAIYTSCDIELRINQTECLISAPLGSRLKRTSPQPFMGAHQFKLCFVPSGLNPVRDEEGHFEGDSLVGFAISDSTVQRLRHIFTRTRHWGDVEEYVSESEWGGELRIWRNDDGEIDEIELSFAPAADPVEKLREFVTIARDAGCYLLEMSSGVVLTPDFKTVFESLRNHHSFRFLSDPGRAVIEAAQKTRQDSDPAK